MKNREIREKIIRTMIADVKVYEPKEIADLLGIDELTAGANLQYLSDAGYLDGKTFVSGASSYFINKSTKAFLAEDDD